MQDLRSRSRPTFTRRIGPRKQATRDDLRSLLVTAGELIRMLATADPEPKARIYAALGLRLIYHPDRREVVAESVIAESKVRIRGYLANGLD